VSEESDLIRNFYECWNDGNVQGALECADPQVEFDWSNSRGPMRGVYRGRQGMRSYWEQSAEAWGVFTIELEEVVDCGDGCVVAVTTVRGRGKGSGIEVEAHGAMVWTIADGKLVGGKLFQTRETALAAAAQPSSRPEGRPA
jgi:ketosteroid isomerase-like protein